MYRACEPFKTNQECKNSKRRDSWYIYKNELGKACFQHDMAYGDFKDLPRRAASDKVLRNNSFTITSNSQYDILAWIIINALNILIRRLEIILIQGMELGFRQSTIG